LFFDKKKKKLSFNEKGRAGMVPIIARLKHVGGAYAFCPKIKA